MITQVNEDFDGPSGDGPSGSRVTKPLILAASPRAIFFRASEGLAEQLPYQEWEAVFRSLGGICGKVFGEELPNRSNALDYFKRFKRQHPEQTVLVHFNAMGRVPTFDTEAFYAGHWLYRAGSRLQSSVDDAGVTLRVGDTRPFRMGVGRFGDRGDDVVIAAVTAQGDIDWDVTEHVQLTGVDPQRGTITVNRAAYGTTAAVWQAGAYIAPHVTSGPYGAQRAGNSLLWAYNYSTECPRDSQGQSCADVLVDDLAARFGPGGEGESFDGLVLDAFFSTFMSAPGDVDGDAVADGGVTDDVDTYAVGTTYFAEQLRRRLPDKILIADGHVTERRSEAGVVRRSQKGYEYLNGIESEGFIDQHDLKVAGFSEGMNILDYWRRHGSAPQLSYINHKYKGETPLTLDYARARLAFAAAVFTDAALTYSTAPPDPDAARYGIGIFDELQRGLDQVPNWLGEPRGGPHHLAASGPDLLHGAGITWPRLFTNRLTGRNLNVESTTGGIRVSAREKGRGDELERRLAWVVPGLEIDSTDLYVELDWSPQPHASYPDSMARSIKLTADVVGSSRSHPVWGGAGGAARFAFRSVGPGKVDLRFSVEGDAPVTLDRLTAHAGVDGMYREFDHGVVFANPSNQPFVFELSRILPNAALRRLAGSQSQDPQVNNGDLLGSTLTLAPRDALFVMREQDPAPRRR